jgi:AcrR family transcriptional regulator
MTPRYKDTEREKAMSQTRWRLLEAAAEEFAREGYVGANVNTISRAAGFAKGTIYNYFPSKQALMLALLDETAELHLELIGEAVWEEEDPSRRLERFFGAGFAFVSQHLARARVMINTIYGPDVEFKTYLYDAYQPMFQLVSRDIIAPGIAQGIFRQVDVDTTATLLMTIYLGTASQMDERDRSWLAPDQVASFALSALRA